MADQEPLMRSEKTLGAGSFLLALFCSGASVAGGGPFGIDHRLNVDNSGIWQRSNQTTLQNLMIAGEIAGALWEGGETRLGKTFWQSIDASVIAAASTEAGKRIFGRMRPSETDDPNKFFAGSSHHSFPSGEVALVSAVITPFVLEYRHDYPAIYALELLAAYDMAARVKVRGHWQSDVLAGFAVGSLAGYYAHSRQQPIILNLLPNGFMVGLRKRF